MELAETIELFDRISKLNHDNWSVWKFKFGAALKQVGLWSLVVNDQIEITKGLDILDQKARTLIGLWVEDSLVPIIEHCSTAHSMWDRLRCHFENANSDLIGDHSINTTNDVIRTILDNQKQSQNVPKIVKDETPHTESVKTIVNPLTNGISEPTTSVSSVRLSLTREVNDDLTQPNLLINDIGLHPKLRELDEKFILKIRKISYDYSGLELFMATHDKRYYKLNEFGKLKEIKKITGKNIINIIAQGRFLLALTDSGDLYGGDFEDDSIIEPQLFMSQVKKICSFGETFILKTDGTVSKYSKELEHFCELSKFSKKYSIQDITSSLYGPIALNEQNQILLPNFWGSTRTIEGILEHPDRENFKSILGGFTSFVVMGKNGQAYFYYSDNSKIQNQLIPSPEPFDACYNFQEVVDDYCLVSISGACYVWFGRKKKLIQSITRSIPDTINLYGKVSMSTMDVWSELPPSYALSKMLKDVETFNHPKNHKIIITIDQFELKEIKVPHCDYFNNQTLMNDDGSCFVSNYPYSVYYPFFHYILTGKTPITKEIIGEILKLFDDYEYDENEKKIFSALKKSVRKKRK